MAMTRVVNIRVEAFDVNIMRPSIWGNPFKWGSRRRNIHDYETWIMGQPQLLARLSELKNKRLGCTCAPKPCHGDVLVRLVAERVQ
jgi:hypothetical protein